jgi:cell division protein FtsB
MESLCLCSCRCISISISILRESLCFLHACIENEKKNKKKKKKFRARRRVGVCSCVFLMCFALIVMRIVKLIYFLLQRAIQIHADAE